MPAPFMIVVFVDADGDGFPVRVPGRWPKGKRADLVLEARRTLKELVEAGELLRPTEPLIGTKVETGMTHVYDILKEDR